MMLVVMTMIAVMMMCDVYVESSRIIYMKLFEFCLYVCVYFSLVFIFESISFVFY